MKTNAPIPNQQAKLLSVRPLTDQVVISITEDRYDQRT
jgi:hypothetical protein